jgi:hypothetical protein
MYDIDSVKYFSFDGYTAAPSRIISVDGWNTCTVISYISGVPFKFHVRLINYIMVKNYEAIILNELTTLFTGEGNNPSSTFLHDNIVLGTLHFGPFDDNGFVMGTMVLNGTNINDHMSLFVANLTHVNSSFAQNSRMRLSKCTH